MLGVLKAPNAAWGHEGSPPFLPSQFSQTWTQKSRSLTALTKTPNRTNASHFPNDPRVYGTEPKSQEETGPQGAHPLPLQG